MGELLAADLSVTYADDEVWDNWVFADIRDASGRLVQARGSGATRDAALKAAVARLNAAA